MNVDDVRTPATGDDSARQAHLRRGSPDAGASGDVVRLTWIVRARPLEPCAVAARGAAVRALVARLLTRDDEALAQLRGVAGASVVVIAGEADALPWVDGVEYLGRDADAPSLLLPTTLAPSAPVALVERALLAVEPASPVAVLVDPPALVSLAAALPVDRAVLTSILASLGGNRAGRGASSGGRDVVASSVLSSSTSPDMSETGVRDRAPSRSASEPTP